MANLRPGEDYLFDTNPHPPLICDPNHEMEEQFSCPKISKVWSINNPTDLLTPQPIVEGETETRPLRHKVQLPSRQSFLANGVYQLELVLQYGDLEEHVLLIDIHDSMMDESPTQKSSELEIPLWDLNSSFPSSSPISNQGGEGVVQVESLDDPSPPPRKKITTRKRKLKQSKTCKICHKKFATKFNASIHASIHLSQEEKEALKEGWKYKCGFCAKRYRTPSQLHGHLVVHTREPVPCDKCGKEFNRKSDLTTHLRLHEQDPAIRRPFNCSQCDQSFTGKQSLTRHVNTVHLRLAPFQCRECGKKFGQKNHLKRHRNSVHLGIRYPCRRPHCGKSFTDKGHLHQHEKTAH